MESINATKSIIANFIEEIWNQQQFDRADNYMHPEFIDHSLPPVLGTQLPGTINWIRQTGASFEHRTVIEDLVAEGNRVIVRITMHLRHVGRWRHIEPTGLNITTAGYRLFRLENNKIIEHRALIDGTSIENQLTHAAHGCKLP